jgi:hypothetical protein
MQFREFAPLVQPKVRARNPRAPKGSILTKFPERTARVSEMCLEWVGPHATMRLIQADEDHVLLNVESPGVSIMPMTFSMTDGGAEKITTSVAAMFDGPTN